MSNSLTYIVRFIALVLTQVLVLNKIQFGGYLNPYIYILFIFLLPLKTPPVTMLLVGFLLGFTVDLFSGIPGIHTAATVVISFYRNRIMKGVIGVTEEDFLMIPGLRDLGTFRFLYYAGFLTFLHHLILFFLEVFSFSNFGDTMVRLVMNTMVSVLFMFIALLLFERRGHESRRS